MTPPNRAAVEADLVAFGELASKMGRGPDARIEIFDHELEAELDAPAVGEAPPAKAKRKKRITPKARCLHECRRRGWLAGDVERRIPFPRPRGTTFDLFGVIDIVAIVSEIDTAISYPIGSEPARRAVGMIGIQACPGARHADHRVKILAEPRARQWLEVPSNRLELWSWSKHGAHFERPRWELRVEAFSLDSPWSEREVEHQVDQATDETGDDE